MEHKRKKDKMSNDIMGMSALKKWYHLSLMVAFVWWSKHMHGVNLALLWFAVEPWVLLLLPYLETCCPNILVNSCWSLQIGLIDFLFHYNFIPFFSWNWTWYSLFILSLKQEADIKLLFSKLPFFAYIPQILNSLVFTIVNCTGK